MSDIIGAAGRIRVRGSADGRVRAGRRVSFKWRCSGLPRRGIKFNGRGGRGQAGVGPGYSYG